MFKFNSGSYLSNDWLVKIVADDIVAIFVAPEQLRRAVDFLIVDKVLAVAPVLDPELAHELVGVGAALHGDAGDVLHRPEVDDQGLVEVRVLGRPGRPAPEVGLLGRPLAGLGRGHDVGLPHQRIAAKVVRRVQQVAIVVVGGALVGVLQKLAPDRRRRQDGDQRQDDFDGSGHYFEPLCCILAGHSLALFVLKKETKYFNVLVKNLIYSFKYGHFT